MKILILSDRPDLAATLSLSLRTSGLSAIGFMHAGEALAALQENDVFIVESQIQEVTGLEVAMRAYDEGWRGSLLIASRRPEAVADAWDHPFFSMLLQMPYASGPLLEQLEISKQIEIDAL